jgi:hypothetical protein
MAIQTLDNGLISDEFSFETQYGTFKDAVVLPSEEYSKLNLIDIEAIKQDRLNTWLAMFDHLQGN